MKPKEVFNELMNLKAGSLSEAVSTDDEYAKITIYASLLVHKNVQYSKVYLGDKLLGTINRYRYQKLSQDLEVNEADDIDAMNEATNLFSSMLTAYLTKVRPSDTLVKTMIIFLVYNGKVSEFRNVRKLSDSEWGIKTIEYIDNLGINSKVLMDAFLSNFNDYPKHKQILTERVSELMFCNNCRERYCQIMKSAWNAGELSVNDPIEQDLIDIVLDLRESVRKMSLNIEVQDLCSLLNIGKSTYRNKRNELVNSLSKYFYNSVYSNLIDLITSLK
jgi:hypothetical protein